MLDLVDKRTQPQHLLAANRTAWLNLIRLNENLFVTYDFTNPIPRRTRKCALSIFAVKIKIHT